LLNEAVFWKQYTKGFGSVAGRKNVFNECLEEVTKVKAKMEAHVTETVEAISKVERKTESFRFNQENILLIVNKY